MSAALDAIPATRLDARNREPNHLRCCGNSWAVAQTYPQAETWADTNLRRLGFRTYLPLYAAQIRDRVVRSLTRIVQRPLFPSYLFVAHDNPDLWRPIREAPGIARVLLCGNRIQYARPGAVEALQDDEALRRTPTTPDALWRPGAACKLARGPFQGADAVVLSAGTDMALVSVMMFGQLREVVVDVNCLRPRDND